MAPILIAGLHTSNHGKKTHDWNRCNRCRSMGMGSTIIHNMVIKHLFSVYKVITPLFTTILPRSAHQWGFDPDSYQRLHHHHQALLLVETLLLPRQQSMGVTLERHPLFVRSIIKGKVYPLIGFSQQFQRCTWYLVLYESNHLRTRKKLCSYNIMGGFDITMSSL